MEELTKFSPKVCKDLGYYVYRLVDPRDGQTFYVGKGKNNRVFAHKNDALKNFDGENYLEEGDENYSLKFDIIKEILDAGLDVIAVIQAYHLTNEEALKIEKVLIEVFSLGKLANKVSGCGDFSCANAITLERKIGAEEYVDNPSNPKYIMIKTTELAISERGNRYDATRSAWVLGLERAKKYPYVLSVTNGVVEAVYKVNEWHKCVKCEGRIEFTGEDAEKNIKNIFLHKRIPKEYRVKGAANPVMYCKY